MNFTWLIALRSAPILLRFIDNTNRVQAVTRILLKRYKKNDLMKMIKKALAIDL